MQILLTTLIIITKTILDFSLRSFELNWILFFFLFEHKPCFTSFLSHTMLKIINHCTSLCDRKKVQNIQKTNKNNTAKECAALYKMFRVNCRIRFTLWCGRGKILLLLFYYVGSFALYEARSSTDHFYYRGRNELLKSFAFNVLLCHFSDNRKICFTYFIEIEYGIIV